MALQPSLIPLLVAGPLHAPHTLDVFVDYVCPFSKRIAFTIDNVIKPLVEQGGKYEGKVKVIIRPQVQPWHASSTLTHESALAVARVSPKHFWPYSLELFKNQADYYDLPSSTLTPLQVRESLAQLAATVIPADAVSELKELLKLDSTPNGGNGITEDLKYTIKFSRQNGVHVSPTVLWNGLIAGEISSSWEEKEWNEFLAAKVGA